MTRKCFRQPELIAVTVPRAFIGLSLLLFLSLLATTRPAIAQMQIVPTIETIAGNGTTGYSGDGGQASSAQLSNPDYLAMDDAGNLYLSDVGNNVIRRIDANTGVITTVAGNGTAGFSGDGGPATSAQLSIPDQIALDHAGNLYIADHNNSCIRMVSAATGIITTIANNATAGISLPNGVAVDGSGNLYIANTNKNTILKIAAGSGTVTTIAGTGTAGTSGDGGPATSAQLNHPATLAFDASGNLYIAFSAPFGSINIVRMINSAGIIMTVAGTGTAGFSGDGGPATSAQLNTAFGVSADSAGNLYIADSHNHRVRKVTNGIITTIAGDGTSGNTGDDGPAINAEVNPFDTVSDSNGNLYIASPNVIRKLTPSTIPVFPFTNLGASSTTQTIYLETTAAETITSITVPQSQGGKQEYTIGTITGCVVDGSTVNVAGTICAVPITFTPAYPGRRWAPLQVVTSAGNINFGLQGTGLGPLAGLTPGLISTFAGTGTGGFSGDGGLATSAQISLPIDIAFDVAGNVYISTSDNRIRKIDTISNVITTFAGTGVSTYSGDGGPATLAGFGPSGIAFDSAGNLYIADQSNNRIRKVDVNTNIITTVAGTGTAGSSGDGGLATAAQVNGPKGVAFDQWGNLYIAEGSRIRKVTAGGGIITTIAGTGAVSFSGDGGLATAATLRLPVDLKFDSSGNLYFSDNNNQRIRRIDAISGVITTVAGSGGTGTFAGGFAGDGGPATSALLKNPSRIFIDPAGNLYIADANKRIRKVDASTGVISTIVGNGGTTPVGDGGPATAAAINGASGVTLDMVGNLYTGETATPRLRKVNLQLSQLNYPTATLVGSADSTDNPQTVIVSNIGNADLTIPPPASGSNPSIGADFTYSSSSTCPQLFSASGPDTLAAGASCNLAINFQPNDAGAISSSAVLTDNSLNVVSTQTVQLIATGLAVSTTTTVSGSPNPSSYLQSVTFTATVAPTSGTALPTGTVQFSIDGTPVGSPVTLSSGTATYTTASLGVGNHTVDAVYTSDSSNFTGSNGSTSQTVSKATLGQNGVADIILMSSPNPSTYQNTVTFTATVPTGVTGTVQFMEGTTLLGTASISGTTASFTTSSLALGTHGVTAIYSGDANYNAATSAVDNQVVNDKQTLGQNGLANITLICSPNPANVGQAVTFTATVPPGVTGTVEFIDGTTLLGMATISGTTATFTTNTLPAGTHQVTAVYNGDANYNPATSAVSDLVVSQTAPLDFTLTLTSANSQTVMSGQAASYAVQVAPTNTDYPGVVTFTATGLPQGATITFSPNSVVANGGTVPVTVGVQSAPQLARNGTVNLGLFATALLWVPLAASKKIRRQARAGQRYVFTFLILLIGISTAGLTACGKGNGFYGQAPKTYTITITATSGAVQHSVNVLMTVR